MVMQGGCVRDAYECTCSCHRNRNVKHVMACCSRCSYCGVNISMGWLESHENEHKENGDTKPEWKNGFPDEWLLCHSFREAINKTPEDDKE